jgi:hypothetical protein
MCLTCGCNDAHQKMGVNVTYEDVRDMAVENGQTVDETLRILAETAALDRAEHVEEYARAWETGRS